MNSIFVGNLPYTACETDLRRLFERHGRVGSVRIMTEPGTDRSRGFAFVHMPRLEDGEEAISCLSGTEMNGRRLTVNESQDSQRPRLDRSEASAAHASALALFDTLCGEQA